MINITERTHEFLRKTVLYTEDLFAFKVCYIFTTWILPIYIFINMCVFSGSFIQSGLLVSCDTVAYRKMLNQWKEFLTICWKT